MNLFIRLSRVRLILICSLLLIAAAIGLWLQTGNEELLLALLPAIVQGALSWSPPSQSGSVSKDEASKQAVKKMKQFWDDEATRRRESSVEVNDEHRNGVELNTVPSRWRRSNAANWAREHLPVEGNSNELVKLYVEQPFRLLLLGEPGSGKTAFCVQLTRALLSRYTPGSAVPVLLQLASWNGEEPVDLWIENQLRTMQGMSRKLAKELLEERQILPILDGLDEGLDHSLPITLRRLNHSRIMRNKPFVITCREQVFDQAKVDHLLERDAEIRILPLAAGEIVEVLEQAFDGRSGWSGVIERLRNEPEHQLAKALNTRLMLYLMVQVFSHSERHPVDLLDDPKLSTVEQIRKYLIGLFLQTSLKEAQRGRFDDDRHNDRWLRYLATHLCDSTDLRLSWWRFFEVLNGTLVFFAARVATGATVTAGLCLFLFGLFGYPWLGLVFGLVLGGIGGAAMSLPPHSDPRALPLALRNDEGPWPSVVAGLVSGIGAIVAIGILYKNPLIGLWVGLAIGAGIGLGRRLLTAKPADDERVLSPDDVLRDDRQTIVRGFLLGAVVIGFIGAGLGLLGRARSLGLAIPVTNLQQEVLVGAGIAGLCGSFTMAILVQATGAWGRFVLTKFILALRHDVPWRLMTFLRVAEQAGILRRLGPQYEFRSEQFRVYLSQSGEHSP